MSTIHQCDHCGADLSADAPSGLCPRCLLAAGLESDAGWGHDLSATTPHTPVSMSVGGSGRRFVPPSPQELAAFFPKLEILGLVGAGGMGAVYKARQRELDRIVALKILPPQLGEDPAFAERFTREAKAMARLSHPNIVGIYDFGRIAAEKVPGTASGPGELCWLVMEYVDGANLRSLIRAGRVESSEALSITRQICDALQYAHEEGVVHRDIKPENVLIDKSGRVRIGDFGLAKIVFDAAQEVSLTGTAELLGTFRYMAPEQLEHDRRVDHRADIYALGIILYELLTGEVPMGRFYPPSEKAQSDPRLDAVVLRALEREPARRFQQASEVKTALDSVAAAPTPSGGLSTITRWSSGMWSGMWSSTWSRPSNGWVVACRLLGMLVAFAGLLVTCFMVWQRVEVRLAARSESSDSYFQDGVTIANQTLLGWQVWHGKLTALAFALVAFHLLANLHRLRSLSPTFVGFFAAAFTAVGFSVWHINSPPKFTDDRIEWSSDQTWISDLISTHSHPAFQATTDRSPRAVLEKLVPGEALRDGRPAYELTTPKLIELLVDRGVLSVHGSHWADGPYASLSLGIALACVGLLEFIFTYAAEPTWRLLGGVRSSVSSRFSRRYADRPEPRISKMALLAAMLGLFPLIPLGFVMTTFFRLIHAGGGNWPGWYEEDLAVAISCLVGLSIFPVTVGLFAVYRVRRSRGLLHGLPLAFAAAITWPLVVLDVVVFTIAFVAGKGSPIVFAPLTIALICNVLAYAFGWLGVRKPLELPATRGSTPH